jgi:penicillin-binding protein 5, C-terminal domain (fragment)
MEIILKKKISVFLILLLFISNFIILSYGTSSLTTTNDDLTVYAKAAVLYDVNTNKILYTKNAYEKMFPASTTKTMTAILTMEKCKLTDIVKASYYAIHEIPKTYSTGLLVPNEELTIEQLLNLLMIPSANDAAYILAQYIANGCSNQYDMSDSSDAKKKFDSDIKTFSNMMNTKALELGCKNTHFINPNGVHNENHYSTAYDLCLIGNYALKFPDLANITKKVHYSLSPTSEYSKLYSEPRVFDNTNYLINKNSYGFYKYAIGLKTGYTDAAGYCIIASAKKDNRTLIAVILGSETIKNVTSSREHDCARLFDFGFNKYNYQTIVNKGSLVSTTKIINGTPKTRDLKLIAKDDLFILVKQDYIIDVNRNIVMKQVLAPIKKGDIVGYLECSVDSDKYSVDLIADSDVESSLFSNIILMITCIIIIIFILYLFKMRKIIKKKAKFRRKRINKNKLS